MAKKREKLDPYSSELTLTNGTVVICHRVEPQLLDLFEDAHPMPEPPMRGARVVGGGVDMVPDEEDAEYQAALRAAQERRAEHLRRLVFDHVELKGEPSEQALATLERYGIEPTPENLLRYSMADYAIDWGLMYTEVLRLSTVTDEEVRKALQRFRDQLGGRVAADEDGHTEESVQGEGG